MRLYHVAGTRSTRVLWLLEEIGAPFELTVMTREEEQTPEHLARHPLGRVPVIEDDAGFVFESVGICFHLADLHPKAGLTPPPGMHERALVYHWTLFATTELEPAVAEVYYQRESDPQRAAAGAERFRAGAGAVEQDLAGREYLAGGRFSVADVVCGAALGFARALGLTDGTPNVQAYVDRLDARPAQQRANAVRPS